MEPTLDPFLLARRIVETAHEPFLVLDGELRVRFANRAFHEIFAEDEASTVGLRLFDIGEGQWNVPTLRERLGALTHDSSQSFTNLIIEQGINAHSQRSVAVTARRLSANPGRLDDELYLVALQDITDQQRNELRLARQALEATLLHEATALAAETSSFEEALETCVEIVCRLSTWPVGHVCLPDPDNTSRLATSNIWYVQKATPQFTRLREGIEQIRFGSDSALPDQIWESGEPAWVINLQEESRDGRASLARECGVKGAFGFPIKIRGETVAVLEFFSEQPMTPDRSLLAMVRSLGEQVGRVIERTRAETALRQREQELTELFDNAAVGLVFLSPAGLVQRANHAFLSTLEFASHEIVGRPIRDLLGDKESANRLEQSCRTGEPLINFEVRLRGKDGSARYAIIDANARMYGNSVVYLRCFTRDITDRKRDEMERSRLAAIVQSSDDAIIGLSPDGLITSWNHGAQRLYGYESDDVAGGSISIIVPAEREEEMTRLLETVKRGERVEQYETVRVHHDGRRIHVSMTASPIRSISDTVTGVAVIERDISERKRIAAEFRRAVQEAERANRAKGEFLANVSHELRTPMNAIIGMTELALDEELPEQVRDYLDTAKDSAEVLLRLLNDILDFSRIEAGRFELDEAKFNLRDSLEETVKTMAVRAHERGLEMALHMPSYVPDRLIGDPVRLRQILTNLLSNAIKFTERGEVVVRVEPQSIRENEVELHFAVQDTGIGISATDRDRIFAPFAQVDATSTRNHGGAGLGLAICRELVSMMDGRLWVDSDFGVGTTFHFIVKFALQPTLERNAPAQVRELKGLPVLVVDDNATNRKILEETLKNWHMEPIAVPSAEQALKELQQAAESESAFPLVIVDGLMPGTDGFTLVEQIRNDQHLAGSTVLMLSSADRRLFRDRCERLEIAAYLEKPVTQSELLDSIVTALQGPPLETESVDMANRITQAEEALKVLLVEDTSANRKVVTAVLKKRGHVVDIATDGREAVNLFKQRRDLDVILMDVQMPNMDGFQATGIIRSIEASRGSHTPIVAMTAHAMRGDRERCLSAGMDSYISKPIDVRRMIRLIERVVRRQRKLNAQYAEATRTGESPDRDLVMREAESAGTASSPQSSADRPAATGPQSVRSQPAAGRPKAAATDDTAQAADATDATDANAVDADITDADITDVNAAGTETADSESSESGTSSAAATAKSSTAKSSTAKPSRTTSKGGEAKQAAPPDRDNRPSDEPVFERSSALKRLGGNEGLFRELAEYFIEDADEEVRKVVDGQASGDWSQVRVAAHSLKGLAANFSGYAATEAARLLELEVNKQESTVGIGPLVADLRREIERLKDALAAYLKT